MKQQYSNNIEKDTIKIIKNIRFTDREIDIIACLIGGRSYKKISSILAIASKTVEYHVRNITLKVGCNSREGIIDFIEKSDKFAAIKAYYVDILVKTTFEQELKKILPISKNDNISCLIFHYDKTQTTKTSFANRIEQHLNISGIKTFNKTWEKGKSKGFVNKIGTKQVDYIIYVLSDAFMKRLKALGYDIQKEATNLIPLVKEGSFPIIFLLLDDKTSLDINKNQPNMAYISLPESKNYYFLFFELLQKISPNHNIDANSAKFKKQYDIFQSDSILQKWSENDDLVTEPKDIKGIKQKEKKNIFKWSILFLICLIGVSFAIFKINDKGNNLSTNQTQNIDSKANNSKQKTTIFNIPPRNNKFTGRNNILLKIKKQLNKKKLGVITQAIAGLGGIGKTHLAKEFAYQAAERKEYSVIFWIPAETANSIDYAYREFAKYLQIDIRGLESDKIKLFIHQELAKKHKDSKVLFILDNVPNYENIRNYVNELNKELLTNFTLHILITSRNQHWPEKPLILDTFAPQEALTFSKKRLPNESKESLVKLIEALHYYPLALNQATAYIRQHTNVDDYLIMYSAKKKEYLNKFSGDKNQYKESLWKTWSISLAKLSNAAKEILFIASYLYPDDIPIEFFDNLSIEKRGEAIKDLRKHSFITLTNNNKSFKLHRLLQEVIRTTLSLHAKNNDIKNPKNSKKNFYELTNALNLIKDKFDFNYAKYGKRSLCSQYLTHAQSLANYTVNIKNKHLHIKGMQLYAQITMYIMYAAQDRKNAEKMWEKMLTLVKQYYNKDESSVLVLANVNTHLGLAIRTTDSTKRAIEYAKKAISIYKSKATTNISPSMEKLLTYLRFDRNLDSRDGIKCDYSFALYNLGLFKRDLADFLTAEKLLKKGIKMLNIKSGTTYKIDLLSSLGDLYMYLGNIKEAKKTQELAKVIVDKKLPGHIEQSYVYKSMAKLLYYIGEYDKAQEHMEKCLQIRSSIFSKNHYRIGTAKALLGLILFANNHINEGTDNLKEAEISHNNNYKKDHPCYVFLNLFMSNMFEIRGEYNKALRYFTDAQKLAIKHWKEKSRIALAHRLSPIEKFPTLKASDKNINYYTKALDIVQDLFGENHIRTARYHYLLGQVFENSWNKSKAKKHYHKALEIANKQHLDDKILIAGHQKNVAAIKERLKKM